MAHNRDYQTTHYPLVVYNFRVLVDGNAMSFSEVSGLQREYKTVTYRHGFSFREGEAITKFRSDQYAPITLKRGSVKGVTFLYDWLERKTTSTLDIGLCDVQGVPVIRWHVAKAIAVKLVAPTFDAAQNEVSIDTLELMAAGVSVQDAT